MVIRTINGEVSHSDVADSRTKVHNGVDSAETGIRGITVDDRRTVSCDVRARMGEGCPKQVKTP